MNDITPRELSALIRNGADIFLLDVRSPREHALATLPAVLIPLGELAARVRDLPRDRELVVYCHHGVRSRVAVALLLQSGFTSVRNLVGGIDAWARDIEPSMPRY